MKLSPTIAQLERKPWTCPRCEVEYLLLGPPPDWGCNACLIGVAESARVMRVAERCAPEFRFEGAGVPKRFRGMLERHDWTARFGLWPTGLTCWEGSPSQVLLIGPEGNGKTGLATILLLEHIARTQDGVDSGEVQSLWLSARDLIAALEDTIAESKAGESASAGGAGQSAVRYRDLFRRARFAPFLVLDDLFAAGRTTPLAVEALAGVLTTRYDHELPTVVTTNARPAQLKQALRSLGSRLLDGLVVALEGPDTRGRG